MISTDLKKIIATNSVFAGLISTETKKILHLIHPIEIKNNTASIPIKIAKDIIYIVCQGELTITSVDMEDNTNVVTTLREGNVWFGGKLDNANTKKVILNATDNCIVKKLRFSDLYYQVDFRQSYKKISRNLGLTIPQETDEILLIEDEQLAAKETQIEQSYIKSQYFIGFLFVIICVYINFLNIREFILSESISTVPITLFFLILCSLCYVFFLRITHLPPSELGLGLNNTKVAVKEALLTAIPLLGIAIIFKFIVINTVHDLQDQPLFDIAGTIEQIGGWQVFWFYAFVYVFLCVPLQELTIRSGVQRCLEIIHPDRETIWQPIVLSNVLFASMHLIASPFAAFVVFFPGLYWGWLFYRHHNLIAVCVSHAIFGVSAFLLIGYLDVARF